MAEDIQTEIDRIDGNINGLYSIISDLKEENEDLRRRITELEEVVDPDPSTDPDRMTKDQKVRKIRKALIRDALEGNGRAGMKYDEVRALFDMSIAPSYSYDLMETAGRMDGFQYDQEGHQNQGQKRVRVNMGLVKDDGLVHSVKKATQSNPA